MNREALRQAILGPGFLDVLVATGTSASSTASIIKSTALRGLKTSQVVGSTLAMTSGTYAEAERVVEAFDEVTAAATLRTALAGAPTDGDELEIYSKFTKKIVDDTIVICINSVRDLFLIPKNDRSLVIAAATYEYTMPATFAYLARVIVERSTGIFDLETLKWELNNVGGTIKLKIREEWPLSYAGKKFELQGQSYPVAPVADATANPIPDGYVLPWVAFYLGQTFPVVEGDPGAWLGRTQQWLRQAIEVARTQARPSLPGSIKVPFTTY